MGLLTKPMPRVILLLAASACSIDDPLALRFGLVEAGGRREAPLAAPCRDGILVSPSLGFALDRLVASDVIDEGLSSHCAS